MTSRRQGEHDKYLPNSTSLVENLATQVLSVYLMTHKLELNRVLTNRWAPNISFTASLNYVKVYRSLVMPSSSGMPNEHGVKGIRVVS